MTFYLLFFQAGKLIHALTSVLCFPFKKVTELIPYSGAKSTILGPSHPRREWYLFGTQLMLIFYDSKVRAFFTLDQSNYEQADS